MMEEATPHSQNLWTIQQNCTDCAICYKKYPTHFKKGQKIAEIKALPTCQEEEEIFSQAAKECPVGAIVKA